MAVASLSRPFPHATSCCAGADARTTPNGLDEPREAVSGGSPPFRRRDARPKRVSPGGAFRSASSIPSDESARCAAEREAFGGKVAAGDREATRKRPRAASARSAGRRRTGANRAARLGELPGRRAEDDSLPGHRRHLANDSITVIGIAHLTRRTEKSKLSHIPCTKHRVKQ